MTTSAARRAALHRIGWSVAVALSVLPAIGILWVIASMLLGPDPHTVPAGDFYSSYDAHEESRHLGVTVGSITLSFFAGIGAICHAVWTPALPNNEKVAWAIGLLALPPVALPAYCWGRRRAIPRLRAHHR